MYRRQFCEIVTRQLRCRWEAPAIRQELSDHIQDHQAALMATGMDRDAAEEAAVAAMGDPKELGRALDRAQLPLALAALPRRPHRRRPALRAGPVPGPFQSLRLHLRPPSERPARRPGRTGPGVHRGAIRPQPGGRRD